jgi:hypothetical protein
MDLLHRLTLGIGSGAIGCAHDRILPNLGLFGGYPGGKRNTFLVRYHDFQKMIDERIPLVHEIGDPREFMNQEHAEVFHYKYMPPTIEVFDKDVLVVDNSSAGGLGDPIERDPALQKVDLDDELTTPEISRNVYGIEASYDASEKQWSIDEAATERLRQEKRKQRLARAVPVEQWWRQARERIQSKDIDPLLSEMYQSSMKMSERFAQEFTEFWALDEDFTF